MIENEVFHMNKPVRLYKVPCINSSCEFTNLIVRTVMTTRALLWSVISLHCKDAAEHIAH